MSAVDVTARLEIKQVCLGSGKPLSARASYHGGLLSLSICQSNNV